MTVVKKALNRLSELVGCGVAAYREYVAKANAEARARARRAKREDFCNNWLRLFMFLLHEAISATAAVNGLVVPVIADRLLVRNPVRVNRNGVPFLVYASWDKPGYSVPAKQIQAQLNVELGRICAYNNLQQVKVVSVRRSGNRRVWFAMALADDIRAAKQAAAQQAAKNAAQKAGMKNVP